MADLFDFASDQNPTAAAQAPLAFRMRPINLDEFSGQEKVLGPGKPLRQWIEGDRVPSIIFWGPPGTGKTTLAKIMADKTKSYFESASAVLSGVKDIKEMVANARERKKFEQKKTILFIDEIHRFNKSQQDALLPHVEDGTVTLIGATTENPSFELNAALLSRARVIRLEKLEPEHIEAILCRALAHESRGLAGTLKLGDDAVTWLALASDGDARRALTSLETVALYQPDNRAVLSVEDVKLALESALERQPIMYDKSGDEHYNVISAFIKSLRDSDPHAGLYYLARMLEGGEDPLFIARRMVVLASEDIGNASPQALQIALSVKDAVDFLGMPEARIPLAQGVTFLALAPKSNAAYVGIGEAMSEVKLSGALPVPLHLRNAVTSLMKSEGYGNNYRYAHDQAAGRAQQTHLPTKIVGKRFYEPKNLGFEKQLKEKLDLLNGEFEKKPTEI